MGCYFETPNIQGIPSSALHVHSRGHPSSIHTHTPHTATVRPHLSQKRVHTVTVHRSGKQPGKRLRQVLEVDWGLLGQEFWGLCPHAGSMGGAQVSSRHNLGLSDSSPGGRVTLAEGPGQESRGAQPPIVPQPCSQEKKPHSCLSPPHRTQILQALSGRSAT